MSPVPDSSAPSRQLLRASRPATRSWANVPRFAALSAAFLIALSLSGCAIETQRNGKTVIGLDNAEIFGRQVGTFDLGTGFTGALRNLNGEYSVKFDKFARVVPVGRATSARIVGADRVGDSATVLIEKSEGGCQAKYQLISMRGAEVNTWDLTGDCRLQPKVARFGDELRILFDMPNQWRYFVFKDARLERFDMKPPPPETVSKPQTPPTAGREPVKAVRKDRAQARTPTANASNNTRRTPDSQPYPGAYDTLRKRIEQDPKTPVLPTEPDFGKGENLVPTRIKLQ